MAEWSEAEIVRIKAWWAQGLSAGQIAKRLYSELHAKCSRNSVISKVHRLGLAARASVVRPLAISRPARARAVPSAPRLPERKRPPKPKPARVSPSDPAALAAAALLANAAEAERRRDGWRRNDAGRRGR